MIGNKMIYKELKILWKYTKKNKQRVFFSFFGGLSKNKFDDFYKVREESIVQDDVLDPADAANAPILHPLHPQDSYGGPPQPLPGKQHTYFRPHLDGKVLRKLEYFFKYPV